MKILIDLQALQTESANRGIGRYAGALTLALIDELRDHEIFVLLHEHEDIQEDSDVIKAIQSKIGEKHTIRFPLADLVSPALYLKDDEVRLCKIMRERFIEALAPDIVLIASLFEFNALSTIPSAADRSYFCAAIVYDLIPLSDPKNYLSNIVFKEWYEDRLYQLKRADALLAISEYVRLDVLKRLDLPGSIIRNISAATDLGNKAGRQSETSVAVSAEIFDLKPYMLCVGGFDKRKNLESLISAYSRLAPHIRDRYRLVLVGGITDTRRFELENYVARQKLSNKQVIIFGFIDDEQLIDFYKNAHLFVFPSMDEGFGLPPLEAMTLGIPTITSNRTSLPEVVANEEALFDPANESEFLNKLEKGLLDEAYRAQLIERGLEQSSRFSWENSAHAAAQFILKKYSEFFPGKAEYYLSFRDFIEKSFEANDLNLTKENGMRIKNLLTRALFSSKNAHSNEKPILSAAELQISDKFSLTVPDYSRITAPYVFSSMLCREQHFHLPLYTYWCRILGETPKFHRKTWEFVYICQVLFERGYLREGLSAICFGVGKEPLASYFASCGVKVLATDLDFDKAQQLGWVSSDQHSNNLSGLNERELCDSDKFNDLVRFRNVDMNHIPQDIGAFDFCWSSCAFEHLGSIRKGLDFVMNSARLLKPGGMAVHTTEYNVTSNSKTLDNNPSFVIFRRCDIEMLVDELKSEGFEVDPIDFSSGEDELERYVDLPPYLDEPHLRLQLAGEYVSTSLGVIIRAPQKERK
jgi:glycosyltransferase involved in cell wall biosynthesis/SAM-dependent methyltransferase